MLDVIEIIIGICCVGLGFLIVSNRNNFGCFKENWEMFRMYRKVGEWGWKKCRK